MNKILSSKIFIFFWFDFLFTIFMAFSNICFFKIYIFSESTIFLQFLLIILTIIVSYLSFKFIEQPFRSRSKINNKVLTRSLISSILVIICLSIFYINNQGALIGEYKKVFSKSAQNIENTYRAKVPKNLKRYIYESKFLSNDKEENKVLIIGDSHLKRWDLAFANQFPNTNFESLNYNQCNLIKTNNYFSQKILLKDYLKFELNNKCEKISIFFNNHNNLKNYKSIILASFKPFSSESNLFRFELVEELQKINPGVEVLILGNYYILPKNKRSCAFVSQKNNFRLLPCLLNTDYPTKDHDFTNEKYFNKFKSFTLVDITKICDSNKMDCPYQINGIPFLFDDWNHNNFIFVNFLLKEMVNKKSFEGRFLERFKYE